MDLFPTVDGETFDLPGAEVHYFSSPDLSKTAQAWYSQLRNDVAWREETIQMFGKTYLQPRLLAWYGDAEANYRYSGKNYEPNAWIPALQELKSIVENLAGVRFNSVLANLYRDGADGMGLHADDEPELGDRPVIASLSLGEERVFRLKPRHRKDLKPVSLPLKSGSLLVMAGDTQRNWKHEVPKVRRPCGPRINLTFRLVHPVI